MREEGRRGTKGSRGLRSEKRKVIVMRNVRFNLNLKISQTANGFKSIPSCVHLIITGCTAK